MANVNANINVNINTQQASAQLRKLSADISRFNQQSFAANSAAAQQQRALNQALIDGVRTSGQFRTSIVPITSAVDRFATSIEKGQLSLGQYTRYAASQLPGMRRIFTREFDMIERVATSRVKTLNTQFVALGDSASGAQKALAMTPVALDQYSSRAAIALQRTQIFNRLLRDGSTQLLNWGKNTQWAGRQLMVGFTIPLGILGAQAAKVFKELEAEAVNFRKVYGDMFTTDVEVEKNLQAVKELATEMTKYGISIQQSMELANVAAQSGARGQDLISQTTEATRLAVLGQMEQQEAIKTTITLQNAFQLSNEELTDSINFLNVVENQSVLSLQNVTEAIPRVAPVIKSLGGDVKDLSVMLVAMREGGVSAAEGANALKTSLARLVSPTAGAVKMAEKFGINLQNIVVENKGDILGAVMELADAMKVLDDLSQQQLMSEIFGKRQYARIGALFNNITNEASQAQRVLELTTMSTRDLAATAERELGAVEESVSAKFTGAMERAKLALAPVGEEFLKALTPVVDFIGKILSKFADLPDGIKTAIVAATGIIGGLAPILLMVTGLVANGLANIGKFILFLRKQVATLRGNGEAFKMYTSAELEAAAAAASLEGKTSTLTATMHLQKPAIETLITLYTRLAASARNAAAAMPATMGGVGVPVAAARGAGFAAVAPKLPVAYRNTGGPIFESASGKTRVPGSGNTDTVPAMLTPGEFVINKKATKENLPLIKAINDGAIGGSQSSMVPKSAEGIQYAFRGLLMQGLRRISGPVRPKTPSGKVFPKWFYDTKTGTNRSRQRMALEDSYQMGMRPKKPSGAEYSLDEIRSMKDREVAKIWEGVHKGHMAPSIAIGEKTDFLPGIMGPMLGGGKGGNISMIRGGNPKEIYDMFSSMEARGIHPMSILFGASKELGYTTNPGLFMRAYNDMMQGLLVRKTNFGTGETFESWAYRIIKRNLGSLNNKDGNFIERMSSVGTVRGIDPMRSMKDGEYQSGRGSLYAAMLPGAFGLNKGGMVPGVQYLSLGGAAQRLAQQTVANQRSANASRVSSRKKPANMNEQEYNALVSSIYTKGTVDDATGYTRPTFRMGKNNEELVFAGFGENIAGLQAAGRRIRTVPTTPEGLIREALRSKPNDPTLTRMLSNFENNTITKKELRLLDNIVAATAITKQGTLSPVEKTSGFAMVLASLTGDSRANSVLSFKRSSLYRNVQTQQQKELKNQLGISSARQSDAVSPDKVAAMHMTKHSIQRDKNGNIVLYPAGQYNIGTDKAVPRSSIHMTLDAPVESHMWGTWDDTMKTIVTPLSQVGKVQNMNPVDTWKLLNPGEALRLSKASVVEPYTDALAYQRVIEKRGLAERGAKPPIVVDDPVSGEVMYLLKKPGSYTEQDRIDILRMQGRPESVAKSLAPTLVGKEADELKALALQTAKRQVGIDTPLQRISGWGLSNPDAQARIDALSASRGIPRGIHQGTRVADLERSGFESSYMSLDNPYNRFTGPELAAYRMTARHGHFKTQGKSKKYDGGIDDILSGTQSRSRPEGNAGGLLVSNTSGKNYFYRNKGGKIPGVQYLAGGGVMRYIAQTAGKVGVKNREQARAIESRLGEWLGGNMKSVNFRELLKTGVARGTGQKELFRGVKMAPADKRYMGFPPEIQNALFMYGKTRDRSYLEPYLGRAVAIEPRSFSQKRKVAKEFSGANDSFESPVIFRLTDEKGILGVNPYAKVGTMRQSENQAREARSFRFSEKEIIPVGNPAAGQRPDAIVARIGIDKRGDVVLDSGSRFSRREISRANKELDETKKAGLKVTPKEVLRKELVEIEKLENRLKTLTRKGIPVNDKKFIDEVSDMFNSIQLQKGYVPGTYNDRKLISKIESRKIALADRVSRAFNAAGGGARLNKGGMAPQSEVLKANAGTRVPGVGNKDTVPAMLTPGEFVVNKEASQKNLPLLHAINDGKTRFLVKGGDSSEEPSRARKPGETRQSIAKEVSGDRAREAQYGRAARAGFQVQREHVAPKTSYGPESVRIGTKPENQVSNILSAKSGSPPIRDEYLRRLDDYFKDEKKRAVKAEKTQEGKDRVAKNIDKKRDSMFKKIDKNFGLNARERQDQAKVLKGMLKDVKEGRLGVVKEKPGAGQLTRGFVRQAEGAIAAAKSYLAPSRPGLPGYVPLGPPNAPVATEKGARKAALAAAPRSSAAERAMAIRKETGISRKDALTQARKELKRARAARIEERKQLLRGKGMSWKEAARIAVGQEDKEQRKYEKRRRSQARRSGTSGGRTPPPPPPTTPGTAGAGDPDVPPKQSRFARANAAVGKFGMGAGMGLSMAGMLPMMKQDEQGKFMGMDAGTAMMGMMGGGTLLSLAPMMGKLALPILAAAAAIGGVALTAKILSDRMRETAEKAAEFGANVGGTENSLNTISQLFNEKTPVQRSTQMQLQFSAQEQEQSFGEFQNYLGSEFGQQFLKDFENLTGAQRFTKLSDYIRSGIAAGVFGREQAISFAKIVGSALNDAVLGSSVIAEIRQRDPQEGSAGLLQLAEKRRKAVEEESKIVAESSEIIGAGIQILQDYSNAVALATEEFADGKITYEEFSEIAQKAKMSQETYSGAIQETLLKENKKRRLVTDVSVTPAFYKEMSKILTEEQLKALKEATTKGGPAIGGKDRQAFEGYALTQFASAMGSGMDPDQAIAMLTEIRENPQGELGRMYSRRLAAGEENILPIIGFEQTANVMAETLGMTDALNAAFKDLGKTFHEAGGNIGEFQAFITNLPEKLRGSMIRSMESMTPEARQRVVSGATQISGAYGESAGRVFASTAYQASLQRARGRVVRIGEQQAPGGGASTRTVTTEEDLKQIKDVENAYLDLQRNFGTEKALEINIAATTLQSGQEVDPAKWAKDARAISRQVIEMEKNFPPEIYSRLNIDFTDPKEIEMWNRSSKVFKDNVLTISQLNPNIDINAVLRFLTLDAEGNELTPDQIADNVIALNKAWKTLETSDDVEVRRKAMMTIVTAYQDESGNLLDPEKAQANMQELEKKFGGRVYELSPDFIYMSLQAKINADELNRQAESIETKLDSIQDPEMKRVLNAKAIDLRNAAAAVETKTNASVRAAISDLPKGGGGGGGGGAQQSPVEGFVQNILNQFKMWTDASAKMGDLNNARKNFVENVLKGDSIFKKLNKAVGFDPARLQEILGMGPEGAKEFLDKYVKDGTLTKAGKNILDAATQAGIGQTIGGNVIAARQARQQTAAADFLSRRGEGSQVIQSIAGDPQKAAELLRIRKEYNQAVKGGNVKEIEKAEKVLNRYINSERKLVRTAKEREEALKSASEKAIEGNNDIIEANNKYMEQGDRHFEREQRNIERNYRDRIKSAEDQIDSLNDQIDEVNKLIEAEEKLNRADQDRIRNLQRQQEMLSRQLEELDRANELDQRRIDTLSREDEIRNRTADALNYELELMSRAEDDIRDSYQKRIDALDEVARVNDYIINQQKQQLDLSRAISEGDIYAATAAAQEMRASSAGFAVEQVRSGLEQGMENQIEGLRTSGGLTREQAEERIRGIEDQSYQTSLQIRDIEDQIYQRNLQMIPIKDQIRNYDMQIRDIQDDIYDRETIILDIQNQRLEPLQTSLQNQEDILDKLNKQVETQIEAIEFDGMKADQWADAKFLLNDQNESLIEQNELLAEEDERLAGLSRKWNKIATQIAEANRFAKERISNLNATAAAKVANIEAKTELSSTERADQIQQATRDRLQELRRIESERKAKTDELLASGSNLGAYAGGLMKYAMGGIANPRRFTSSEAPPVQKRARGGGVFGNGSRDSIPAMLTPGEFVVRKAMVDKYGVPMMQALNQGSFAMPRYETGRSMETGVMVVTNNNVSNISAPVYNTYDMKFSINGANQSADEIANKVMFKMKHLQNQQIRGNRGY